MSNNNSALNCKSGKHHIDDGAFIDALDFDFRDTPTIARFMLAAGTPAKLTDIRQRMAEFVQMGGVEVQGDTWRIEPPVETPPLPAPPSSPPVIANDNRSALALNTLHLGDGLELMRAIPDKSINLILCDPPYGTCGAKSKKGVPIDQPLDLERLWAEYRRIIAPGGNILLFGSQPYSTDLINSARDLYKYTNIWRKDRATGFNHARNKPLKDYEEILVFSPSNVGHRRMPGTNRSGTTLDRATFNPWKAREVTKKNNPNRNSRARYAPNIKAYPGRHDYAALTDCPRMVMDYAKLLGIHSYQKPVPLLDDLIRMYSNEGDIVLDNCAGSGSTAVAAIHADRQWIAIEKVEDVFEDAQAWITKEVQAKALAVSSDC